MLSLFLALSLRATFPGHAPSIAYDGGGKLHVVYVDNGRVMHRVAGEEKATAISPESMSKIESRGENGPVVVSANGRLSIVYAADHHLYVQHAANGSSWSAPIRVDDDKVSQFHSFLDAVANKRSDLVLSWLDNRSGHQGVQTAVVHGASVSRNVAVDPFTCECCKTALLARRNGDVVVAYRDHGDKNLRNMVYAVSRDGGASFKSGGDVADDQWRINGCPDSGPSLAETDDGTIWAAWFNGRVPAIEVAAKRGGRFDAAMVIAEGPVNHPQIAALPDGRLAVIYESGQSVSARVHNGGKWGEPFVVSEGAHPRFARHGNDAVVAVARGETIEIFDWK